MTTATAVAILEVALAVRLGVLACVLLDGAAAADG